MSATTPLLTACSGFLFAVLWMDLMFDAQVRADRHPGGELPESVLDSIARYYRRAVTESRPMSHLIAVVMVILLGRVGVPGYPRARPGLAGGSVDSAGGRADPAGRDAYGAQCRSTRRPF